MRAEVAAVSCPSCGVGLQALGGGRVVLQVCAHCGAALDAVENYRLLKTFADIKRPNTPFRLGQQGRIAGVDWTVIGILGWAETYNGQSWNWVDHQLYAPTHGYAWLTLEDGHLILTRSYRGAMSPGWVSSRAVEQAKARPRILAQGAQFDYYETSDATINFAEGEFSWLCLVGERVQSLCFLAPDAMLTLSGAEASREVELSTYLPQTATWDSFGLKPPQPTWRVHPLQPYRPWREELFLGGLGAVTALTALVLAVYLSVAGEPVEPIFAAVQNQMSIDADLPITTTQGLVELRLNTDLHNAWAGVEVELTDPTGVPLFQTAREVSYYQGVEDGESWSEGSQSLSITFRPTVAGDYALNLEVPEGGSGEASNGLAPIALQLSVWQGEAASIWMWLLAVFTLPLALITPLRLWLHKKARWRGSDWTEED